MTPFPSSLCVACRDPSFLAVCASLCSIDHLCGSDLESASCAGWSHFSCPFLLLRGLPGSYLMAPVFCSFSWRPTPCIPWLPGPPALLPVLRPSPLHSSQLFSVLLFPGSEGKLSHFFPKWTFQFLNISTPACSRPLFSRLSLVSFIISNMLPYQLLFYLQIRLCFPCQKLF